MPNMKLKDREYDALMDMRSSKLRTVSDVVRFLLDNQKEVVDNG